MQQSRSAASRFSPSDTVDFVIVGSGAAGGIIAKELSTAGFSVVVLEQGPRLTEAAVRPRRVRHVHAEQATPTTRRRSRRRSGPRRRTRRGRRWPLIYGRLVGGSNAHFTGNFWRLRPSDFNEASVLGGVPGHGTRRTGRSPTRNSSRTTRRPSGSSACPASPDRSIRRGRARIRCRRCR